MWPQNGGTPNPNDPLAGGFFSGQQNMFPGYPVGPPPDLNVGSLIGLQGASSMAVNMAVQPLIQSYLGLSYVPGRMSAGFNPYDQMVRRAQLNDQQAVGRFGAQLDQRTYYDYLQSAAILSGQNFGAAEQAQARRMAEDASRITPMIAGMAPDFFDQLHGRRGSALVLGQQVAAAGRFATDPVTGARGFTSATSRAYTEEIFNRLYGPDANVREMRGVGAGQAGLLFDELQRRGLGVAPMDRDMATRQLATDAGKSVEEITKLPDFGDRLRKLDAGRAAQQLKEMSAAVGAMRELFGEAGRPDAPMSELINAIQGLTQGGLGRMNPRELERTIRQAGNVARQAGSDIRGIMGLTATVAPQTDALGMTREAAVRSAIGGMAFADAYGRQIGNLNAPGALDKEQAAALGATLNAQGIASPQFQRLAAVKRAVEEYGVDAKGDSDFARLYRALEKGDSTYTAKDGKVRSVFVTAGTEGADTLIDTARRSGVDPMLIEELTTRRFANQQTATALFDTYGAEAQKEDVKRRLFSPVFAGRFGRLGDVRGRDEKTNAERRTVLGALGAAVGGRMLDELNEEQKAGLFDAQDKPRRDKARAAIRKIAEDEAKKQGITLTEEEKARLDTILQSSIDDSQELGSTLLGSAYGTPGARAMNAALISSPGVIRGKREGIEVATAQSGLQSALAGLGSVGPTRELAEKILTAGPGTSLESLIAAPLGFQNKEERDRLLEGELGKLTKRVGELNDLDPRQLKSRIEALQKAGTAEAAAELREIERQFGKPVREIVKMTDDKVRLAGINQLTKDVYAKSGILQEELDQISSRTSTESLNRAFRAVQGGDAGGARKALTSAGAILKDERLLSRLGGEGGDMARRMQIFATALDQSEGRNAPLEIRDKDKEEVQTLREEYAARVGRLVEADRSLQKLGDKTGGREKLADEVQATDEERRKYQELADKARAARADSVKADEELSAARMRGAPQDELRRLDNNAREARKRAMAAETEAKRYLAETGLSDSRLTEKPRESKLSAAEQKEYRESYAASRRGNKDIVETIKRATAKSADYGGDVVGLLSDSPESRASVQDQLQTVLQEDLYVAASASGRVGPNKPRPADSGKKTIDTKSSASVVDSAASVMAAGAVSIKDAASQKKEPAKMGDGPMKAVIEGPLVVTGNLKLDMTTGQAVLSGVGGLGKK